MTFDPELTSLAVQALVPAWSWRFAFIVGVGVLPFALARLVPAKWRTAAAEELHFLSSIVGLVLVLFSLPLAVDTFLVEAEHPWALSETRCTVAEVPSDRWGRLQCAPGGFFFVEKAVDAKPGDVLMVTHLKLSGLALKTRPAER